MTATCQTCQSTNLIVYNIDSGGFISGYLQDGQTLYETTDAVLPSALSDLDINFVLCLDCGQVQGDWPESLSTDHFYEHSSAETKEVLSGNHGGRRIGTPDRHKESADYDRLLSDRVNDRLSLLKLVPVPSREDSERGNESLIEAVLSYFEDRGESLPNLSASFQDTVFRVEGAEGTAPAVAIEELYEAFDRSTKPPLMVLVNDETGCRVEQPDIDENFDQHSYHVEMHTVIAAG